MIIQLNRIIMFQINMIGIFRDNIITNFTVFRYCANSDF